MTLSSVQYIARRSHTPGHELGATYNLPVLLGGLGERFETVRDIQRADGGDGLYVLDRVDQVFTLQFAPVKGRELLALREFLDSTEGGESFRCIPYGDTTVLQLKRLDSGHAETVFMRVGSRREDLFTAEITAVLSPLEAEPADIYDPIYGGGLGAGIPRDASFVAGSFGYLSFGMAGVVAGATFNDVYILPSTIPPGGTLLSGSVAGKQKLLILSGGGPPEINVAVKVPAGTVITKEGLFTSMTLSGTTKTTATSDFFGPSAADGDGLVTYKWRWFGSIFLTVGNTYLAEFI